MAFKTSALTGVGVDEVFNNLAKRLLAKYEAASKDQGRPGGALDFNTDGGGRNLDLTEGTKKQPSKCC